MINDLRELCNFYIRRENIDMKSKQLKRTDHLKSHGNIDNSPPKNHYSSDKLNNSKSVNRNKSFSSYLSQQEVYGAFESIQIKNQNIKKPVLQRNLSTHSLSSFASANQLEASISYIERTARKLLPILNELKKRMIPEKPFKKNGEDSDLDITIDLGEPATGITKNQALDLKNILGYLNQGEWT